MNESISRRRNSNGHAAPPPLPKAKRRKAVLPPPKEPVLQEEVNEEDTEHDRLLEAIATFYETYEVHASAEAYPIMVSYSEQGQLENAKELLELASSIETSGQRLAAVVDQHGRVVDGRNRIIACIYLGIEPWIVQQEFVDDQAITDYVYDTNGPRRHLTVGQKAIAYALLYPEPHSGPRKMYGVKQEQKSGKFPDFDSSHKAHARAIVKDAPELANRVRDGNMPFDEARRIVYAGRSEAVEAVNRMARLRRWATDLAALVDEGKLNVKDAYVVYEKRTAQQRGIINGGLTAGKAGMREIVSNVTQILSAAGLVEEGLADPSDIANMIDIKAFEEAKAAMEKLEVFITEGRIT